MPLVDAEPALGTGMYPFSVKRLTVYARPSKRQATLAWLVQGISTVGGRSFLFQRIAGVVPRRTSVECASLFCLYRWRGCISSLKALSPCVHLENLLAGGEVSVSG